MFKSINIHFPGEFNDLLDKIAPYPEIIHKHKTNHYLTTPNDTFLEHILTYMKADDNARLLWLSKNPHKQLIEQFEFIPDYLLFDDEGNFMKDEQRKNQFLQILDQERITHYITAMTFDVEMASLSNEAFIRGYSKGTGLIWNPQIDYKKQSTK